MILTAGKLNAEQLLAGNASGKKITKASFGTNGTPPDPADTTITGAVVKDITTITYLSGNVVSFETELETTDPAMTIREVGLLNDDNVLVHRKIFDPEKVKVDGIAYRLTYKIKVI